MVEKKIEKGIPNIREVMYTSVDIQGNIFVDKYDDITDDIKDF